MRADVDERRRAPSCRATVSQEHRAAVAPSDQAGDEASACGLEVEPFEVAALGAHSGAAVVEVEILDVDPEDLAGAAGGLVQEPPEGSLPQREATAREYSLELRWR
jgi:hypothetical protein